MEPKFDLEINDHDDNVMSCLLRWKELVEESKKEYKPSRIWDRYAFKPIFTNGDGCFEGFEKPTIVYKELQLNSNRKRVQLNFKN